MTNPIYATLAALLRSLYGDTLNYKDGGYQGRYRDRVEAAIALVDAKAVGFQIVTVMREGKPYRRTLRPYVDSQEHGRKVRYYVHIPERGLLFPGEDDKPACGCPDFQMNHAPICKHLVGVMIAQALQAGFDAIPTEHPTINLEAPSSTLA